MGMFTKGVTKSIKGKRKVHLHKDRMVKVRVLVKGIGRKQGAVATAAVGLSVSSIMAIRSKKRLEELKQQNLDANQRAAVNKALRQVAEKEAAKAKMGGTKPKPSPKK